MLRSNKNNKLLFAKALLVVTLAMCTAAFGSSGDEDAEGMDVDHHEYSNLLAMFIGAAREERRDNGLALGVEYERRFNRSFGIGGLAEYTFGDLDVWVFAVPFAYHLDRWKIFIAPGVEDGENGSEFLTRLGGEYGFKVDAWEISPQFNVDFIDGDQVFVLGVTFGRGF